MGNALMLFIWFPVNGLFVLYLWSLSMCNLIQGYVMTKQQNYWKGLIVLCLVNAFYIPIVLHYTFLVSFTINLPFWIGNIVIAIIISIKAIKNKWRIAPLKWLILFPVCGVLTAITASYNVTYYNTSDMGGFNVAGLFYLIIAVVIFPICYYLYAKNQLKS